MATDPKKKVQQKVKTQAKRQVKKAAKKNPVGFLIALVVIVIVVAIALVVMYFTVPSFKSTINDIISPSSSSTNNGSNNSGGNGSGTNQGSDNSGNNEDFKAGNITAADLVLGEDELKVHFIDIGQGDCIYIQFPDGKDMLIDCGYRDASNTLATGIKDSVKDYLLALITDNELTYLMLTHGDQDHVSCMDEVFDLFQVDNIYMPNILAAPSNAKLQAQIADLPEEKLALFKDPNTLTTKVYAEFFIKALSEPNCNIYLNVDENNTSNSIVIHDEQNTYNLTFYCMTEQGWNENTLKNEWEKNEISPVGILEYKNKRIVFTGDSNKNNEPEIAERIGHIDCDVLKVAHHGAAESSLQVFLDAITCEYAVFCCGTGNTYGHPRQAAIDRMSDYTALFRTDLNGNIILTISPEGELIFKVERDATQEQERTGPK